MMKFVSQYLSLALFVIITMMACAPVKTIEVWHDESQVTPLKKVFIIAIIREPVIREQFEKVLTNELSSRGIEAIPSFKVFPSIEEKPDRELVLQRIQDIGVDSVIVSRGIDKQEINNHQYKSVNLGGDIYTEGWYQYAYDYSSHREYDTDYIIVSTKIYSVDQQLPFWSSLSQVKVKDGARQKAVNLLLPTILKELEDSQLISPLSK